jgi:hypothetical protein
VSDKQKLHDALVVDELQFRLEMLEAIGYLAYNVHQLRGLVTWLVKSGAAKFDSEAQQQAFYATHDSLEVYESFIWQLAPPRALLSQLRAFRLTGHLDEYLEKLLDPDAYDEFGRLSLNIDPKEISELIHKLNEIAAEELARQASGGEE